LAVEDDSLREELQVIWEIEPERRTVRPGWETIRRVGDG
jgi:hypothetical protein